MSDEQTTVVNQDEYLTFESYRGESVMVKRRDVSYIRVSYAEPPCLGDDTRVNVVTIGYCKTEKFTLKYTLQNDANSAARYYRALIKGEKAVVQYRDRVRTPRGIMEYVAVDNGMAEVMTFDNSFTYVVPYESMVLLPPLEV